MQLGIIIYHRKNFDQIDTDQGPSNTFFLHLAYVEKHNAPSVELHREKSYMPLPLISHCVNFYSCTYVVSLRVFCICSVTPFFEWTVLKRRPTFPVGDSSWLWHLAMLHDSHQNCHRAVLSMTLSTSLFFSKAT